MAQTFNDFVAECVAYPYSKERYQLMKECAEVTLMEQYIENQRYLAENVATMVTPVEFTEGYLMESASEDQIDSIYESFGEKLKEIGSSIASGIGGLIERFISFLKSLARSMTKSVATGNSLYSNLKGLKLNDDELAELAEKIKSHAETSDEVKVTVRQNQPFKIDLFSNAANQNKYNRYFQAAFTDTTALVDGKSTANSGNGIAIEKLTEMLNKFASGTKGYDYEAVGKMMKDAVDNCKTNGTPVDADTARIEKLIESLNNIKDSINEKKQAVLDKENKKAAKDGRASDASKMENVYSAINTLVGNTIAVNGGYIAYRTAAHKIVAEYIKATKDAKKEQKKAEKAAQA